MKKLILIIPVICFAIFTDAQTRKTSQGSTGTTGTDPDSIMRRKVVNGKILLHTMKAPYKIYATYVKSKVTGYYAIDAKGKKLPARLVTKGDSYATRNLKCYTCVRVVDADTGKMAEECEEIPCPDSIMGEKTTIKIRQ